MALSNQFRSVFKYVSAFQQRNFWRRNVAWCCLRMSIVLVASLILLLWFVDLVLDYLGIVYKHTFQNLIWGTIYDTFCSSNHSDSKWLHFIEAAHDGGYSKSLMSDAMSHGTSWIQNVQSWNILDCMKLDMEYKP